jgi:hypothetical protein
LITTTAQDEILRHPYLLSPQSKLWRRVILEQSTPVFLVRYEDRDGPAWVGETAIYWELQAMLDFCASQANSPNRRIVQVALITPSKTDPHHSWRMQTVQEIWAGRNPVTKMHVVEYVTTDGLRYLEGPGRIKEGGLTQVFAMGAVDA